MVQTRHRYLKSGFALLAPVVTLILLVLLLGGCTLLRKQAADPLVDYRAALGPRFNLAPGQLNSLLAYSITVRINPSDLAYTGTMEVSFPISGTAPVTELYFRLYPNLKQFGGRLQVSSASVNNAAVNFAYTAEDTALHLVPPQPLRPGSRASARLSFNGEPPDRAKGVYTLVGRSQNILSMMGFYPMLAARRNGDWALDLADPQGDAGFQDAALYKVAVTTSPDQVLVATGTQVAEIPASGGWVTHEFVQGPAREFALLMSPRYQMIEEEAYGTRVRSYFLPEDVDAGKSALYDALAALEIYSDQFGPYPYRDMAVVEAPLTFRGQEFPGVSLIGIDDYGEYQSELEKLVSHEVAHQWWYNQVGSDQTNTPWLDEGLAEFSMYYYFSALHGESEADLLRARRWAAPVSVAKDNALDAPIGRPVTFYNKRNYETIVYAKGALFFATLRDEMGPEAFRELLRTYLSTYRWRIASPDDFRSLAEKISGRDLSSFFSRWVDGAVG